MNLGEITRRTVNHADRPFLFELYASTRDAELAQVPWTAEQKLAFVTMQFEAQTVSYRESFPHGLFEIISAGEVPAGRIYWSRQPEQIHILDITVAPAYRNSGIGSYVLREILEEADRTGKSVTIYVEDFNPSSRLFERLGFQVAAKDGFQLLLQRLPVPGGERSRQDL
jgi:ribosomal protein S18 acetylase RimI-like enzyme